MLSEVPILLIRADASVRIGTGHIMRMIALAQAWRASGGKAVFYCAEIPRALEKRLREQDFSLERIAGEPGTRGDRDAMCAAVAEFRSGHPPVVALDGYHFSADFQLSLKGVGCRLLCVDDCASIGSYHADFVLDQNIAASERLYSRRDAGTRLLLGPRFALIRQEFLKYQSWERAIPDKAQKLLVTLGGSDADNVTMKVIDFLKESRIEAKVVVGGSNPHLQSLRRMAQSATNEQTRIEIVVNPPDMPDLMAWADYAVSGGGSTSWELALTGLPPLFVILAENQRLNTRELERRGYGLCLGEHPHFDQSVFRRLLDNLAEDRNLRFHFSSRGRSIVDGFGAARVAQHLLNYGCLELLPVTKDDLKFLWEWANDADARSNSFDSAPISWDRHINWCRERLEDQACSFWIASAKGLGRIGCVRLEHQGREAVISVVLSPHARGKGFGSELISTACNRLFRTSEVEVVKAFIKPENNASIRAFRKAGFQKAGRAKVKNTMAEFYTLRRTL